MQQAEHNRGKRAEPTTEDRDRVKALKRANSGLRQAKEIHRPG